MKNSYPEVNYKHLPCKLTEGQHYIGERPDLIEKELAEYLANSWPLSYAHTYHCKGYNVHQKINNGHYIRAAVRYYKVRYVLRSDPVSCFISAYNNLAVFDEKGHYVPLEKQKYERRY